jgi:hypothetical protein
MSVRNCIAALILGFALVSCAVSEADDPIQEGTGIAVESAQPASSIDGTAIESKGSGERTGPSTNANGNGEYCFNKCSSTWYVNPNITVNCTQYGQNTLCPHNNRGPWIDAKWCKVAIGNPNNCPAQAILL